MAWLGNVFGDSASAMQRILDLHFPHALVLDVNYGQGVFYKKSSHKVIGVDLRPTGQVVADNRRLPFRDDCTDVGVLDPPYKRGPRNLRYQDRYGVAPCTEPRVTKSYLEAMPEILRTCRQGMIIKCQDATDGHRFYARHITIVNWMKEQTGLDPHDMAIVARKGGASSHQIGTPRYMQQALSYFLIWKWKSKHPFRRVVF